MGTVRRARRPEAVRAQGCDNLALTAASMAADQHLAVGPVTDR